MKDTIDNGPPREGDVCQINLQRDTSSPLRLLPAVKDLGVSSHSPDRVGGPVIQLVSQVPGSDFHGRLEPLVQVVCLRGVPGPGPAPHPSLQPGVQAGAGVAGPSLVASEDKRAQWSLGRLPSLAQQLLGEAQPGRHVLGTQHLVPFLPVGQVQLLRQREARLRAGGVAAQAAGLADRQLGVAGDRARPRQVEILHSLLIFIITSIVLSKHFPQSRTDILNHIS